MSIAQDAVRATAEMWEAGDPDDEAFSAAFPQAVRDFTAFTYPAEFAAALAAPEPDGKLRLVFADGSQFVVDPPAP